MKSETKKLRQHTELKEIGGRFRWNISDGSCRKLTKVEQRICKVNFINSTDAILFYEISNKETKAAYRTE
jgi:hypothetical protein